MSEFVEDKDGNKCYINYFGDEQSAQKALDSLKSCNSCINCSSCSGCSSCSYCSSCSDCSDCSDCSGCSSCSYCSDCSGCSDCSYCSDCSDCSDCSGLINVQKDLKLSSFVPKIENIDKVVYEACNQPNALDMERWHTCETTHCRAGWVVTLAGKAGKELEAFHNTLLAAQLIYLESGSPINPCRFFDDNKDAMKDMKERAEKC